MTIFNHVATHVGGDSTVMSTISDLDLIQHEGRIVVAGFDAGTGTLSVFADGALSGRSVHAGRAPGADPVVALTAGETGVAASLGGLWEAATVTDAFASGIALSAETSGWLTSHRTIAKAESGVGDLAMLNAEAGLWIAAPTDIEAIDTAHGQFAVLAAAGSNTLSVMRVSGEGAMAVVDHVMDDRGTRFDAVQALASAELDGQTYVFAAGSDGGISLFEMLPTGALVHLAALEGTVDLDLFRITDLDATVVDGAIHLFVSRTGTAGIAEIEVRPGAAARIDAAGSQTLEGTAGQRDVFVLHADGARDEIAGFERGTDALDLSYWAMLRDVSQLTIAETNGGARISYRDEVLVLHSADGAPLTADDIAEAGILPQFRYMGGNDVDMTAIAPATVQDLILEGGDAAEIMTGQAGDDRLMGLNGADTLSGGTGDDTLSGGNGGDVLKGGTGDDFMVGGDGRDRLKGEDGNDWLFGGGGADTLSGGDGNDVLEGREGDDFLNGGAGHDTATYVNARAAVRADLDRQDRQEGDAAGDVLIDIEALIGSDFDDILNGDAGDNAIQGGKGADKLSGRDGDDLLIGGGHADTLSGGNGGDTMQGGGGQDTFLFNKGADLIEDFQDDRDTIGISSNLAGSTGQAMAAASIQGGAAVFDFGGGDVLTVAGVSDLASLENDLFFY